MRRFAGIDLGRGTIVDATPIAAPSSTKNLAKDFTQRKAQQYSPNNQIFLIWLWVYNLHIIQFAI